MRFLQLLVVTTAYFVLFLSVVWFNWAIAALGVSLLPIICAFWGKKLYCYLRSERFKATVWECALALIVLVAPIVLTSTFMEVLEPDQIRHSEGTRIAAIAGVFFVEWSLYVLIWSVLACHSVIKWWRRRRECRRDESRQRENAAQNAIRLAEEERQKELSLIKQGQDNRIRSEHEHEQEFYRLREETLGLFLKHHALLETDTSVSAITNEFEKWRPIFQDRWNDFVRFTQRQKFQIVAGAARNNLIADYTRAEQAIRNIFPRDQFMMLVTEAVERDRNTYNVDECLSRLASLHDKLVNLFQDRAPDWQAKRDAVAAETYDQAFAETDDEPEGQSPFDDNDNRLTHQRDVG